MNPLDSIMTSLIAHVIRRPDIRIYPQDDPLPERKILQQFHPGRLRIVPPLHFRLLVRNPEQGNVTKPESGGLPVDLGLPADPSLAAIRV